MKQPNDKEQHESSVLTFSTQEALGARAKIYDAMQNYNASIEEKERSLGLFLRGSLFARFLAIVDIYKLIINIPGVILDIGAWRGQTAVLCENLRAIYEPMHFNRKIICFDTFEGYKGFSEDDKQTSLHKEGSYSLDGENYAQFLRELLILHEKSNAMGHYNNKHKVIAGDCTQTMRNYFEECSNEIIALSFFDLNVLQATKEAFDIVWNRLVPGGIVAFWQLTNKHIYAEGRFYSAEILGSFHHKIKHCETYPSLCYIVKD